MELIQLAYQQTIDAAAKTPFEQQVFNVTFAEFCLQQQSFAKGQDLFSWSSIRSVFPKSNPALPFKVGFAIAGLIDSLNKQIPGLRDTLGVKTIPFIQHRFELIDSDVKDRSVHKVNILYWTGPMTLFAILGDTLLVALGDVREAVTQSPVPTFLVRMTPLCSIGSYFVPEVPAAESALPVVAP